MITSHQPTTVIFPLNQADGAWQPDVRNLLAREVYKSLGTFITQRVAEVPLVSDPYVDRRQHNAILVDGARGTGKSSVLVNLPKYLKDRHPDLMGDVHILNPVDPTLLEAHDDLFLNVVIAAVMSDKAVKAAMTNSDDRVRLHRQLQTLGHALESRHTQGEKKGLDKIRAFIGNQEIIEEVHKFFAEVLRVLKRKLLILPIDDVDTSINRAFENLEVVRRYLTSPFVLPIISGDIHLYQEVSWRDFHGRMLKDSKWQAAQAQQDADGLADEYLRKILPLQYRLRMPDVSQYLGNPEIVLGGKEGDAMTLPVLQQWLETLLNDRTNGLENSRLPVPIPTVRALSQVVNRTQSLIPDLQKIVNDYRLTPASMRHYMLMPKVAAESMERFAQGYDISDSPGAASARQRREKDYKRFKNWQSNPALADAFERLDRNGWVGALCEHFRHDPQAGTAFLVLEAERQWRAPQYGGKHIFDTPLFQPLLHADKVYTHFSMAHSIEDWPARLKDMTPARWLKELPDATILPYPLPEVGASLSERDLRIALGNDSDENRRLLFDLVVHRNFYSSNKLSALVCIGRVFELVITSLQREVSGRDIEDLLGRAPFFSVGHFAGTKTLTPADPGGSEEPGERDDRVTDEVPYFADRLASEIAQWRADHNLRALMLSPWLVYNVMNKVFNQAEYFNRSGFLRDRDPFSGAVRIARKAFNCIWAAFGSFEKGPAYGLPAIVANVNIGDGKDFTRSDLYRQNITPFYGDTTGASEFGKAVGAITYLLASHPLKRWTDDLPWPGDVKRATPANDDAGAASQDDRGAWLKSNLGSSRITSATHKRLRRMGRAAAEDLLQAYEKSYGRRDLREQFNQVFTDKPADSR